MTAADDPSLGATGTIPISVVRLVTPTIFADILTESPSLGLRYSGHNQAYVRRRLASGMTVPHSRWHVPGPP